MFVDRNDAALLDRSITEITGVFTMDRQGGLREAVIRLVQKIPDSWAKVDRDALSSDEETALKDLVGAGLVETRISVHFVALDPYPSFEAKVQIAGEYGIVEALQFALPSIWTRWKPMIEEQSNAISKDQLPFYVRSMKEDEWRLTSHGKLAQKDLLDGLEGLVLDFVLKSGRFSGRPAVRGDGKLLAFSEIDKSKAKCPGGASVSISNWNDGAVAIRQSLESLISEIALGKVKDSASDTGNTPTCKTKLTLTAWNHLAIGIDEHWACWAVTPVPIDGSRFPKSSATRLELNGTHWRCLLDLAASSKDGSTVDERTLWTALIKQPDSKPGRQDSRARVRNAVVDDALSDDNIRELSEANKKKFRDALGNLRRRLRELVSVSPEAEDALIKRMGKVIETGFVVRYLIHDENGICLFGVPPRT